MMVTIGNDRKPLNFTGYNCKWHAHLISHRFIIFTPFLMVGGNTDVISIGYNGGFLGFREDPTLFLVGRSVMGYWRKQKEKLISRLSRGVYFQGLPS